MADAMRRPPMLRRTCVLVLALSLARPAPARAAEPSEGSTAAAESLFQEGRKLAEAKKYGEACPKFLASHKLAPAVGTLLNLADCYEKNGQLASAWARFHEAIALAQRLNRPDREKIAQARAEKLEPRLVRLTIDARDKSVEVKLDGDVLDAAVLGTALPVDPGKHTVDASAKGKKPWSTTIEVSEKNRSPSVEVPALEDAPIEAAPAPRPAIDTPDNGDGGGSGQKTIGLAVGAVGVVGLGVGAFFGIQASSQWKDAKTHCNASYECDATGVDLTDRARSSGNLSTISFIAGGALTVLGAVLFFTAPKKTSAVNVGVGPGSILVGGSFR